MIRLQSVTQVFPPVDGNRVRALDRVDFDANVGELVMVVGPSGSGKSTLLYTIGGMLKPSEGEVVVAGKKVYSLSAAGRAKYRRDHVGFVFQTFNLIPFLSCLENVALPALLSGRARRSSLRAAGALLERFDMDHRVGHRPAKLSVGERQRVALARSLINEPEVLLADEPTGNLDPAATDNVMRILIELSRSGQTVLMVTHDHQLAEKGSRIIHLQAGRLDNGRSAAAPGLVA